MTKHRIPLGLKFTAVVATGVATYLSSALAGYKAPPVTVSINVSGRVASGNLGDARNTTTDTEQAIYCGLSGSQSNATVTGFCAAHDATAGSAWVTCTTTNTNIVGAIKGVTSDSHVQFNWDASNNCIQVQTYSGSFTTPKKP